MLIFLKVSGPPTPMESRRASSIPPPMAENIPQLNFADYHPERKTCTNHHSGLRYLSFYSAELELPRSSRAPPVPESFPSREFYSPSGSSTLSIAILIALCDPFQESERRILGLLLPHPLPMLIHPDRYLSSFRPTSQ